MIYIYSDDVFSDISLVYLLLTSPPLEAGVKQEASFRFCHQNPRAGEEGQSNPTENW